uniref:Uncharacterized protein n=1 Tax=Melanopsichium pennsylvanicum 4 TaxID=1398559 RepID=A0A077R4K9_9BASI|nr:putative protein [Melanopsichium pennsylvanicum 4]
MSAATPTAAAAAANAAATSTLRAWLPHKHFFGFKTRLFSKNILYTRDIFSHLTSSWTSTCISSGLLFLLSYFLYLRLAVSSGSTAQTKPLWQLSVMLAAGATVSRLDTELDSDEYEDDDSPDRSRSSSGFLASSKERESLRRILARDNNKRSSIVRITSSDPSSVLSESPMQVDLEPSTKRSFWPAPVSNASPSDSNNPNSTLTASPTLGPTPSSGGNRRRREPGRLLNAEAGRRQHTASPSRSPLASTAALPTRPTRIRPVNSASPLGRTAARKKRNSTSSLSSVDGNSPRPTLRKEDSWADEAILQHEKEQLLHSPSMASETSFTSAAAMDHSGFENDDAQGGLLIPSPTSSTFSISRAPSILKKRPQTFRTASLRDIDISYSLMQRKASLPTKFAFGTDPGALQPQAELLQTHGVSLPLNTSTAPPPYQQHISHLASPQTDLVVFAPKTKSIRLIEPDWTPHLDQHIRAKERLETATRFAAFKLSTSDMTNKQSAAEVDVDDFWFERFTQSTAAAGRDWDWRKRRARMQRAAALGMALGQSGFASPPNTPASNVLGAAGAGNVGKTDVQLQQQQREADSKTAPAAQAASSGTQKQLPAAPLVTFTEQQLQSAPQLSINTEYGRRAKIQFPPSPTAEGNDTPMSPTPTGTSTPMGGIFGAVLPKSDSVSAVMAARMAQRHRASDDASIHSKGDGGGGGVGKINRRQLSAFAASASPTNSTSNESASTSSPGREVATFPLATNQSYADARSDSPTGIPGRLSSLSGTMGRKVSLTNLRAGFGRKSGSGDFLATDASGMELVHNSPDLDIESTVGERSRMETTGSSFEKGPRSSADMYRTMTNVPPCRPLDDDLSLSRTDSQLRHHQQEPKQPSHSKSKPKKTPSYLGGNPFAKLSSAPTPTTGSSFYSKEGERGEEMAEELLPTPPFARINFDQANRDSIEDVGSLNSSNGSSTNKGVGGSSSSSSDSLRRRMRARSATDSYMPPISTSLPLVSVLLNRTNPITARNDGLGSLSAAGGGCGGTGPPVVKSRTRNGSRSSIVQSASNAKVDLGGTAAPPEPSMQPEPAPRGMVRRARSASISSNGSSIANSSKMGSRKASFNKDGSATATSCGIGGGLGLLMTESNPGTPADDRRPDPFAMTALEA